MQIRRRQHADHEKSSCKTDWHRNPNLLPDLWGDCRTVLPPHSGWQKTLRKRIVLWPYCENSRLHGMRRSWRGNTNLHRCCCRQRYASQIGTNWYLVTFCQYAHNVKWTTQGHHRFFLKNCSWTREMLQCPKQRDSHRIHQLPDQKGYRSGFLSKNRADTHNSFSIHPNLPHCYGTIPCPKPTLYFLHAIFPNTKDFCLHFTKQNHFAFQLAAECV